MTAVRAWHKQEPAEPGTSKSSVVAAGTLCGYCCTGVVGLERALGMAGSDHNPTAVLSNLIPVSAALGEEAVGEQQLPLQRTAEALLLPLTKCRCSVCKKKKLSKD